MSKKEALGAAAAAAAALAGGCATTGDVLSHNQSGQSGAPVVEEASALRSHNSESVIGVALPEGLAGHDLTNPDEIRKVLGRHGKTLSAAEMVRGKKYEGYLFDAQLFLDAHSQGKTVAICEKDLPEFAKLVANIRTLPVNATGANTDNSWMTTVKVGKDGSAVLFTGSGTADYKEFPCAVKREQVTSLTAAAGQFLKAVGSPDVTMAR